MLILSRKVGEAVIIDNHFKVLVSNISKNRVSIKVTIIGTDRVRDFHLNKQGMISEAILTDDISVQLVDGSGRNIRLGFSTPGHIQVDREEIHIKKQKGQVFVFGSNEAGIHGAGAALHAARHSGAVANEGIGRHGNSYAIPTKDRQILTLPLDKIEAYVDDFIDYARDHHREEFFVTKIGCGLAGYQEEDIAPFFHDAPGNCALPRGW
jgi:sRNA-binding carbon storage regulator CsrA